MARLITIALTLLNYVVFEAKGQSICSSEGRIAGLTGCECNFLGACNDHGRKRADLNIENHLPKGLDVYASFASGKRLAFLCESNTVPILYDCNNRIPLYAATVITGKQLAEKPVRRPTNKDGTFQESGTGLELKFQQNTHDYTAANQRVIKYYPASGHKEEIDKDWYKAKYPDHKTIEPFSDLISPVHRGHMIESRYGMDNYAKKVRTFVYTNAVPQFGTFNSIDWNKCERNLIRWGQVNCLREGTVPMAQNVQMFIVVGAIPSTFPPSNARFFGRRGFSARQDNTGFRVNVPTEMWTASCCTFEHTAKDGRTHSVTRSTAFRRENLPEKYGCERIDVDTLERLLTAMGKTRVNLFPFSGECKKRDNYEILP